MTNTLTTPVDTNQKVVAYWIVSPVSDQLAAEIATLQAALKDRFSDAIWAAPRESLHISFTGLSPIYEQSTTNNAPTDVPRSYIDTFRSLIANQTPIQLHFDTVEAFPAAIILKATDDGSYQSLRNKFNQKVDLPVGTKATPTIIHTTICKFHTSIDLDEVKEFLATKTIDATMTVQEFRIVREKVLYLVDYDTLERFKITATPSNA